MRTTLTLDDDVATRLKREVRRTGRPFKALVNECLRAGLEQSRTPGGQAAFVVQPHHLGELRQGLSLDRVSQLLETLEGPAAR